MKTNKFIPNRISIRLALAALSFFPFICMAQIYVPLSDNVGIGTSTPAQKLDVLGSINASASFMLGGTNTLFNSANNIYANIRVLQNNSTTLQDGMYINYYSTGGTNAHLRFCANGTTERMRIDAATGNVLIGTTTSGHIN